MPSRRALSRGDEPWFTQMVSQITEGPVVWQIGAGATSGWMSGYVFSKVSRGAAVIMGGSLILYQVGVHKGYIKVNWRQVDRELREGMNDLENHLNGMSGSLAGLKTFIANNLLIATSFAGGFLLGIGTG